MTNEDLLKLAKKFEEKLEAYAAKIVEAPTDVKVEDLTWLEPKEREYVIKMGDEVDSLMNPPPFVLDKDKWKKAKKAVKKYWKKYKTPYAVILDIYKNNMGGRIKKRKKKSK